ncbi:MAG: DNA-binding protein [Epsilonproteobacteria bacterium]|nr:DNA-binding protein [Campylobacterota bacterium]
MKRYFIIAFIFLFFGFYLIHRTFHTQGYTKERISISSKNAYKHIGEIQTVCGIVASTYYSSRSRGQPTFLNLDRSYPNQIFTIVIWGSDRYKFKKPPEILFKMKRVCATGRIKAYRGIPQIIVRNPSQIMRPLHNKHIHRSQKKGEI